MNKQNKFLIAGAILAIVLLMLIAYWTYDTQKATRSLEEKMETIQAVQSLRLLTEMLGREGDCGYGYDMTMRLYDRLWADESDPGYLDTGWG